MENFYKPSKEYENLNRIYEKTNEMLKEMDENIYDSSVPVKSFSAENNKLLNLIYKELKEMSSELKDIKECSSNKDVLS